MENLIALPELAYDILRFLVNGSMDQAELLNHFLGRLNDTSKTLVTLGKLGYVSGIYRQNQVLGQVKLEPLGHTALILHDEQKTSLDQQLKEREEQVELAQAQVAALERQAKTQEKALQSSLAQVAALENVADTLRKDLAIAQSQVAALERQAKAQEESLEFAKQESISANKQARKAIWQSRISNIIAAIAAIIALLAWVCP